MARAAVHRSAQANCREHEHSRMARYALRAFVATLAPPQPACQPPHDAARTARRLPRQTATTLLRLRRFSVIPAEAGTQGSRMKGSLVDGGRCEIAETRALRSGVLRQD